MTASFAGSTGPAAEDSDRWPRGTFVSSGGPGGAGIATSAGGTTAVHAEGSVAELVGIWGYVEVAGGTTGCIGVALAGAEVCGTVGAFHSDLHKKLSQFWAAKGSVSFAAALHCRTLFLPVQKYERQRYVFNIATSSAAQFNREARECRHVNSTYAPCNRHRKLNK